MIVHRKPVAAFVALAVVAATITAAAYANAATTVPKNSAPVLGSVAFSIAVPKRASRSTLATGRIRPQYVSVETRSVQILTDGKNPVNIDITGSLSVKFKVVLAGPHVFSVKTYDQPGSRGNLLSLNSTGMVIVKPIGLTVVALTLEGIVQNIGLELAQPIPKDGVPANIALNVNLEDAAQQIIIGPARFYNAPVTLTTTDPANGARLAASIEL
jgi:hypothetical protein